MDQRALSSSLLTAVLLLLMNAAFAAPKSAPYPEACKCPQVETNNPMDGSWSEDRTAYDPGQHLVTDSTEVWTHFCLGQSRDGILIKLFGKSGSPANAPAKLSQIQSVSIFDSPAVPDLGGHSIIGGLLTGKGLTAILPNLAVCLVPPGSSSRGLCTGVCRPGHACLDQPFVQTVIRDAAKPQFTIRVYDVDRPGSLHVLVATKGDPAQCTTSNHCSLEVADTAAYGKDAHVEIAFKSGPVKPKQPCAPKDSHIIQFVRTDGCIGQKCGPLQSMLIRLARYQVDICNTAVTRLIGIWYLDAGNCDSPYLTPETYCSGKTCCNPKTCIDKQKAVLQDANAVRYDNDEPVPVAPDNNDAPEQKSFVDFVMCANEVKDVIQWTRTATANSKPFPQGQACNFRVPESNYQVSKISSISDVRAEVCSAQVVPASSTAPNSPAYKAVMQHLNCSS